IGWNYRVAPAGEKPDSGSEQDDEVGAAAGLGMDARMNRAEAAEREFVIFGNGAARLGIRHHRCMRQLGELHQLFCGFRETYSTPGQNRGRLRLAEPTQALPQCRS